MNVVNMLTTLYAITCIASAGSGYNPHLDYNDSTYYWSDKIYFTEQTDIMNLVSNENEIASAYIPGKDETFQTQDFSSEIVIYDKNNIKMTMLGVAKGGSVLSVKLLIENKNETDRVVSSVNKVPITCSVNNHFIDTDYFYAKIPGGQSVTESYRFNYTDLKTIGVENISDIANMELGFFVSLDGYEEVDWFLAKIETPMAHDPDFMQKAYQSVHPGENLAKTKARTIVWSSDLCRFNQEGVQLTYESIIRDFSGKTWLILEFENYGQKTLQVNVGGLYIREIKIASESVGGDYLRPHHKMVVAVPVRDYLGSQFEDIFDLKNINNIGTYVELYSMDKHLLALERITFPQKEKIVSCFEGEEVYNDNDITILYKGIKVMNNESHLFFYAKNNGKDIISIYENELLVDGKNVSASMVHQFVDPDNVVILDVTVLDILLSDADISPKEFYDAENMTIEFSLYGTQNGMVDKPVLELK